MDSTFNTSSDTSKGMNGNLTSGNDSFVKALSHEASDDFSSARSAIEGQVGKVRSKLYDASTTASRQARMAAQATNQYVQDNPWKTVGIAVITGLVVGALVKRR